MMTKKRPAPTEKQLAALDKFPRPIDAPEKVKAVTVNVAMYPESIANLEELLEGAGAGSKSIVVRKALAYAVANKEDFLEKAFGVKPG